jgi:hypothetical protein
VTHFPRRFEKNVETGQTDNADPERLGQCFGRRHADAEPSEETWSEVDCYGIDTDCVDSDLGKEVLHGRDERLDVSPATRQRELGLHTVGGAHGHSYGFGCSFDGHDVQG